MMDNIFTSGRSEPMNVLAVVLTILGFAGFEYAAIRHGVDSREKTDWRPLDH